MHCTRGREKELTHRTVKPRHSEFELRLVIRSVCLFDFDGFEFRAGANRCGVSAGRFGLRFGDGDRGHFRRLGDRASRFRVEEIFGSEQGAEAIEVKQTNTPNY